MQPSNMEAYTPAHVFDARRSTKMNLWRMLLHAHEPHGSETLNVYDTPRHDTICGKGKLLQVAGR
jgi:hypothetical protein